MISERKFSSTYSSFWSQLLPTGDSFLRRLNLACERVCPPLESSIPIIRERRAVINELAFRIFKEQCENQEVGSDRIAQLSLGVISYIKKLSPYITEIPPLSDGEITESSDLADSLSHFFPSSALNSLKFWPKFVGCGNLHTCKGDILYNDKLIEVKAGDRHFRIADIRQIITYLSLNFESHQFEIIYIELINPRTGLSFEISVRELIEECSAGRKPVDVFSDIVEFISMEIGSN